MAELNVIPPTTSLVCGAFILTCYISGYFRGELRKEDIEIYDPGTEPEAPDPRDMIDLEVGGFTLCFMQNESVKTLHTGC